METYDKWPIVHKEPYLDIRRYPRGNEDYGLMMECRTYLDLPRGTIPDIANVSVEEGNKMIQNLLEQSGIQGIEKFFEGTHLNLSYLNASICKAYMKEEQRRQGYTYAQVDNIMSIKEMDDDWDRR